jgi:ribosomal protein S18 acetylase RimI-like enzyme
VSITHQVVTRADAAELVHTLMSWEAPGGYAPVLHAGDLGWFLRLDDATVDGALHLWRDSTGSVVALAIVDAGVVLRVAMPPSSQYDGPLAESLLGVAESLGSGAQRYVEAPYGSVFRASLLAAGWELDPDPWYALHRPLDRAAAASHDPLSSPPCGDSDVADRVAVQRAAFDGSTFTGDAWRRMAAGPGFDPALEILTRDESGRPVAAATGWSAGAGRCAILEPVGTHREHTGKGHGRRCVQATVAALARAGASGVTVHTPASNAAAVALYRSCGLQPIAVAQGMRTVAAATHTN